MADKKKLRDFLAGNAEASALLEYNHLSPGSLSDLVNVNRTSRQARLGQTWQDFIVELEALWLDIMDEDPDVYEQAEQALAEIRQTPPEGCRQAVTAVQQLIAILQQTTQLDPDFGIMAERMSMLSKELEYICDVFDPDKPQVPGAPVPSKKDWEKQQAKLVAGETVPGDGQADATYAAHDGQGEDADQVIPGQEEVPEDPDAAVEDPVASKDKPAPQLGANPDAGEGQDPRELTPAPANAAQPQDDLAKKIDAIGPAPAPAAPVAPGQEAPPVPGKPPVPGEEDPKGPPVPGKEAPDGEEPKGPPVPGKDEDPGKGAAPPKPGPGEEEPDSEDGPKAGAVDKSPEGPEKDGEASKGPPVPPGDNGEAPVDPKELAMGQKVEMEHTDDPEEAKKIALDHLAEDPQYYTKLATVHQDPAVAPAPVVPESMGRPAVMPTASVVLTGLRAAINESDEVEGRTLAAARTLETAMEEYSDVSSALVEVGLTYPGNPPRIDLFVEWTIEEKGKTASEWWGGNKGKSRKKGKTPWGPRVKGKGHKQDDSIKKFGKAAAGAVDKAGDLLFGEVAVSDDGSPAALRARELLKLATERDKIKREIAKRKRKKKRNESFRPSDCYGYCRLMMTESGLEVMDANDNLVDTIVVTEKIDDMEVVERVYNGMTLVYDASPKRVFTENAVVGALIRLTERMSVGEQIPETAFAQVLASLRPRLGLNENIGMVGSEIGIKLEENFEDTYNYFFSWAVRSPKANDVIPDEIAVQNGEAPDAEEYELYTEDEEKVKVSVTHDMVYAGDYFKKKPHLIQVGKKTTYEGKKYTVKRHPTSKTLYIDLDEKHYYEGEHVTHWRTPSIGINLVEKKVFITHAGGKKEMLDRKKTDEDISARLASMAYQREGIKEGHLIEINRRDKCDVVENVVGSRLGYNFHGMLVEELWDLAVERGVHLEGVELDRDKLLAALRGEVV